MNQYHIPVNISHGNLCSRQFSKTIHQIHFILPKKQTWYFYQNKLKIMYENKREPLAPRRVFYLRLAKNTLIGCLIIFICLMMGIIGYHYTAHIEWLDSLHN